MKQQIFKNILSNYAGRAVGMAIGFFLIPFLVTKLGRDVFGLIVLFEAIMLLVEAVSTSVRVALSRYATFSLSSGDTHGFRVYLSTGRVVFFALSVLILGLGVAGAPVVPVVFRIPEIHVVECQVFFALLACSFAITMPNVVFWSGLYAKQRFDLINLATSAGIILRGVAIFVLFSFLPPEHVNLVTYGLIHLAMTWLQNFVIYLAYRKVLPEVRVDMRLFDRAKVREILAFSFYTLSGHLSSISQDNILNWMINRFWGLSSNAIYGIGMKFSGLLEKVFLEPTWTLTPAFTDLVAKGEYDRLKHFLFVYTKAMAMLVIPVGVVLSMYAPAIIRAWVGPGYDESAVIMIVTLIGQMVYMPVAAAHNFPNAYGKVKAPALMNAIFSVLSVAACYLLAVRLGWGLKGIAIGTTALSVAYSVLYAVPYAFRISGFSLLEYWRETFIKPCLWACLFWGGVVTVLYASFHGFVISWFLVFILVGVLPLYLLGSYRWVLNDRDRGYVTDLRAYVRGRLTGRQA